MNKGNLMNQTLVLEKLHWRKLKIRFKNDHCCCSMLLELWFLGGLQVSNLSWLLYLWGTNFSKFWQEYKPFFFLKVPTPHPKGVFAYIVQESNWHCHLIPLIWIIGTHQLYQLYALWGCMGKKLADSCPLLLWEVEIHATWLAARQENYTQLKKHQCYS